MMRVCSGSSSNTSEPGDARASGLCDLRPHPDQKRHVASRSDDVAPSAAVRTMNPTSGRAVDTRAKLLDARAQPLALRQVVDPLRDADMAIERHQHEIAARHREIGRQPGAFRRNRILRDLHQQRLAVVNQQADVAHGFASARCRALDCRHWQPARLGVRRKRISMSRACRKPGRAEPDVHERRLHTRAEYVRRDPYRCCR